MSNLIDFIFEINISKIYSSKAFYYKNDKIVESSREPPPIKVYWSNIDLMLEELTTKQGKYASELRDKIKYWQSLLGKNPTIQQGRNIITHRGGIPIEIKKGGENGIFVAFSTDKNKLRENDESMKAYFDAVNYCISHYAIILKLYSDFYEILYKAVEANETIFKQMNLIEMSIDNKV